MKLKNSNPVHTVLIISFGFQILFVLTEFIWAFYTGLFISGLGLISEKLARIIDFVWMKLAKLLSFIVPNILLTIIFYLFLFPISILSKVFGYKNLLNLKNIGDSLWIDKPKKFERSSFEKMW